MKKLKLIFLVLICIFISGCNIENKEESMSLEDAYFYLLNTIETKEEPGTQEIKELLKEYKLNIVEHPKPNEFENQNSYEYIFTDDTETYLSINFIVSGDEDTIDFIQYNLDDDNLNLVSNKGDEQWGHSIKYNNLDKSLYKKILAQLKEFDISVPREENENSLEDAYYYVIGKMSDNKEIRIEDIKKLLRNYSLEVELVKDDPTINLKEYFYIFRNNEMESVWISTNVENNEESFSQMSHFIGQNPKLVLSPKQVPHPENGKVTLSLDYDTGDEATFKNVYDVINKIKDKD